MRSMKIGKSGVEASVVGIGAWAIGGDSMWGASDDAESIRTIHRARELGVTLLDTAPAYGLGHSEEVVGKALAVLLRRLVGALVAVNALLLKRLRSGEADDLTILAGIALPFVGVGLHAARSVPGDRGAHRI